MSPTSYQAAPPRVSDPKCRFTGGQVKLARPRRVRRRREPVQQLLVTTNHPELLAGDPLLYDRVGEDRLLHIRERIDLALERVDLSPETRRPRPLRQQVVGSPFPALDRKHQRGEDDTPE